MFFTIFIKSWVKKVVKMSLNDFDMNVLELRSERNKIEIFFLRSLMTLIPLLPLINNFFKNEEKKN